MVDGNELMANAVVEQAADDYRKALAKQHELKVKLAKANDAIAELEEFFLGADIQLYTNLDGRYLKERIEDEMARYGYDYKAVMRAKQKNATE